MKLREINMLDKPKAILDIRKYSFSNRMVDDWNSLPDELISQHYYVTRQAWSMTPLPRVYT